MGREVPRNVLDRAGAGPRAVARGARRPSCGHRRARALAPPLRPRRRRHAGRERRRRALISERDALRPGAGARARPSPARAGPGLVPAGRLGALGGCGPARDGRRRAGDPPRRPRDPAPRPQHGDAGRPDRLGRIDRLLLRGRAAHDGARSPSVDHGLRPLPRRAPGEQAPASRRRRPGGVALRLRARPGRPGGRIVDEPNGKRGHALRDKRRRRHAGPSPVTSGENCRAAKSPYPRRRSAHSY